MNFAGVHCNSLGSNGTSVVESYECPEEKKFGKALQQNIVVFK